MKPRAERLLETVAAGPYCYACGRVSLYAPPEDKARLNSEGVATCLPSDCPAWNVTKEFNHGTGEWEEVRDCEHCGRPIVRRPWMGIVWWHVAGFMSLRNTCDGRPTVATPRERVEGPGIRGGSHR